MTLQHDVNDKHCAFWNGTKAGFFARLVLQIHCPICMNVGTRGGMRFNEGKYFEDGIARSIIE